MAEADVKIEGFKELERALLSIADGEVAYQIQRDALQAVVEIVQPELLAVTPERVEKGGKDALPPGALKAAIRGRIRLPKNGEAATATVDFGKLDYIAHFVDWGHINPTAKNPNKLKHTPGTGFVRKTQDATAAAALEAYSTTLQAGIDAALEGTK
jgi:hypothetical protein